MAKSKLYQEEPLEEPLIPRKKPEESEMDITPMIDITFLLLIFFTVASKMDKDTPVELPQAQTGTTVVSKDAVSLYVRLGGEHAVITAGDGTPFPLTTQEDQERRITDYVEKELTSGGKHEILVLADKGVKYKEVARVARAVGLGSSEQHMLHLAVLEQ